MVSSSSPRRLQVFLCHASGDKPAVRNLYQRLKSCNIDPWLDEENLLPGQNWEQEIRKAVRSSDVVIVCLSPGSVSKTGFVQKEIKFALDVADEQPEGSIFLIALKLEDCETPERLKHLHWVNYKQEGGFDKVIRALQRRGASFHGKLAPIIVPDVSYTVSMPPPAQPLPSFKPEAVSSEVPPSQGLKSESVDISPTILSPQPAQPLLSFKPEALSLLHTLKGHTDKVFSVAFSLDGQTLASGSADNTIKLWDVASRKEVRTLRGHTAFVKSVAFSPDGRTLASGSNDWHIKLWNPATGQELRTLTGHKGNLTSVAFSPDGRTLTSVSSDKTIKLWNPATGQEVRTLTGFKWDVYGMAFSPDSKTLASGELTIKLWNVATGQELRTLTGPTPFLCSSLAFRPDGQTLASGSGVDQMIKLWNVATGQELRTLTWFTKYNGPMSVAFSPDGKTLASGNADQTIKLWDPATGQELRTLTGYRNAVWSVAFISLPTA